jgi:hypothetical protein
MPNDYDSEDHWFREWEREQFEEREWLEARELERADTLAERGLEHRPLGSPPAAERPTSLVKP